MRQDLAEERVDDQRLELVGGRATHDGRQGAEEQHQRRCDAATQDVEGGLDGDGRVLQLEQQRLDVVDFGMDKLL